MLIQRFITITALAALNAGALVPLAAFAEDSGTESTLEFTVELNSDPVQTDIEMGESYVQIVVTSEIAFKPTVTSSGMVSNTWDWYWDPNFLDCESSSDSDSPELTCLAIAEGDSDVSITMFPVMEDGTTRTITSNVITVEAVAEEESEDDSDPEVSEDEDSDEDSDHVDTDDLDEEVFYEDDVEDAEQEEDGEVVVEDVAVEDIDEDALQEFVEATTESGAVKTFFYSVRWGYFLDEGEERPDLAITDWDGVVDSRGLFSLPVKTLRFEKQQDSIDFSQTTATTTWFSSDIYNATDGILFKAKWNPEVVAEIVFDTDGAGCSVDIEDLLVEGVAVCEWEGYNVVFNVWTPEEWVAGESETQEVEEGVAEDAEKGSWYEAFMNQSIGLGFFNGDRHSDGRPMGTIRPGDGITRFELLKVASELAFKLDMGVGATTCDPKTVEIDSASWMGDHWADGYVQCLDNSGLDVRLFNEIIGEDLSIGNEEALRVEVAVTLLEVLGLTPHESTANVFTDSGEMTGEEEDFANYLYELGVITGYSDGHFGPDSQVNRAEMFKIVSLLYASLSL